MRRSIRSAGAVVTLVAALGLIACTDDAATPTTPGGGLDARASTTADSEFADEDGNGIPDEGEVVTGAYKSVFAYEGEYGDAAYPQEDWYWDLGDGRIYGTVGSIADLDQDRLTVCDYKIQYRGSFENDPFLDSGWDKNEINCTGFDDNNTYSYTIVHMTDPRYTGEKPPAFGGEWEYSVYTIKGQGNIVNPYSP